MIESCIDRGIRHGYVLDSAIVGGSDPIGSFERALFDLWAPGGPDTIVVCRAEERAGANVCEIPAEPRGPYLFDDELARFLDRRLGFELRPAAADDPLHASLARVAVRTARRGTAVVLSMSGTSTLADELSAAFFTQRRSGTLLVLAEADGVPEGVEALRRSAHERSRPALAALLGDACRLAEHAGAEWARSDAWGSAGFAWRGCRRARAAARACSSCDARAA
ncbi:Hypothetical protein A7982_04556 [Minicystis rosea]|nr:Hypothetical protein A7982_04556 [Minicystis rosea]